MASSSLPAQDGSARARVVTTANAARKRMIEKVLFRINASYRKNIVRCVGN
jgi:hypothetical protein